uniref:TonB-dependent receptor n=1 Tax=Undibacterium luofuense TaxID=2828733 RepID=UPI0030EE8A2A
MKKRPQLKKMSLAIALCIGTAPVAFAQTADKTDKEAKKDAPQRVVITGSNIKRIDSEPVSPVATISKEQIARSGVTSVVDLLRNVSSAGGNLGEYNGTNSFRNGATSINLRGLPTLVLLNGYRLPMSGSDGYDGSTSVDLNAIPLAAIERVEILKDGASAIYGTDAVGGVVNFITKQDNAGITVDASYGRTGYNDGGVAKASVAGGLGNRSEDRYNLTYAFSAENSKTIKQSDRPWANRFDFRKDGGLFQGNVYGSKGDDPGTLSFGGSQRFPDPACAKEKQIPYFDAPEWFAAANRTGCFYTPAEGYHFRPEIHRYSLTTVLNYDISDQTSAFIQLFGTRTEVKQISPPSSLLTADGDPIRVAANNPFNPYGRSVVVRRLFPAKEGGLESDVNTLWLVGGIKSQIGNWELSASAGHSEERGNIRIKGAFLRAKMDDYLTNGKFNPFGGNNNSADIINQLSADMGIAAKTKTDFVKLSATTEFGKLPGGAVGFATGAEFKRETLSFDPTKDWQNGAIGGYTVNGSISGSENLKAVYGEFS